MARNSSGQSVIAVRHKPWFWLVPFGVLVAAFQLLPIIQMLSVSVQGNQGVTLDNYKEVFVNSFYLKALKNSLLLSLFSSVAGILLGGVVAYAFTKANDSVRDSLLTLANMTSNFAGVPLAFAYIILLGSNGVVTLAGQRLFNWNLYDYFDLYSWVGLGLVYIYFQLPMAVLLLFPAYQGLRPEWSEAALNMGARPWQYWYYVGIPYLAPAFLGTFSILMANAMGAYATAYALTSGNYNLLSLRIANLVAGNVELNPQLASAIAVLLGIAMVVCLCINQLMVRAYKGAER